MKKLKNYFCPWLKITNYDASDIILTSPGDGDNFIGDSEFD